MRRTIVFLLLVVSGNPASAAEDYLALSRTDILQIFRLSKVTEIAEQARLVPSGDSIFVANDDPRGIVVMFVGRGEKIHPMRVVLPLVNLSAKDNEVALEETGALLEKLSPGWGEARLWPRASLKEAWTATVNAMKAPPSDLNALIPTMDRGEIIVSTFGVPPDLVIYNITNRRACVPRMDPAKPNQLPMDRIC